MSQRRRSLLRRLLGGLRSIVTGGAVKETAPPPQIPTEPPEEVYLPPEDEAVLPPAEDVTTEDTTGECDVKYIGKHKAFYTSSTGKKIGVMNVLPRWKVGGYGQHMQLKDVKCLLDEIGYKDRYVIIITGIPEYEYPGKEGEQVISLSFPLYGPDVWESLDMQMRIGNEDDNEESGEYGTAEGWINWLLEGYQPMMGQDMRWTEVQSIDILDQYF